MIIPVLNEEICITPCVRSIQSQNLLPLEIIVVDNGCTDRTAEIARQLGCLVIGEKMQGLSHARNAGAETAKGDVLCFIDADGTLSNTWLQAASLCFAKANIGAVSGLSIYTHSSLLKRLYYNLYVLVTSGGAWLSSVLFS